MGIRSNIGRNRRPDITLPVFGRIHKIRDASIKNSNDLNPKRAKKRTNRATHIISKPIPLNQTRTKQAKKVRNQVSNRVKL